MMSLLVAGIIIAPLSHKYLKDKMISKLFRFEVNNETEEFTGLLNSSLGQLLFSKLTRATLLLEYHLNFNNYEEIKNTVKQLINLGVKKQDVFVELMKVYVYFLDNNYLGDAVKLEKYMYRVLDSERNVEFIKDIRLLHGIYIENDPFLVGVLQRQLKEAENFQAKAIIMFRLSKLNDLLGNKSEAKQWLEELKRVTKGNIKTQNI